MNFFLLCLTGDNFFRLCLSISSFHLYPGKIIFKEVYFYIYRLIFHFKPLKDDISLFFPSTWFNKKSVLFDSCVYIYIYYMGIHTHILSSFNNCFQYLFLLFFRKFPTVCIRIDLEAVLKFWVSSILKHSCMISSFVFFLLISYNHR